MQQSPVIRDQPRAFLSGSARFVNDPTLNLDFRISLPEQSRSKKGTCQLLDVFISPEDY